MNEIITINKQNFSGCLKKYPFRKGSQNDRILCHLQQGHVVFNWQIREMFGVLSHTARISEIRSHGFNVQSEELENGVWRYWLPESECVK